MHKLAIGYCANNHFQYREAFYLKDDHTEYCVRGKTKMDEHKILFLGVKIVKC